MERYSMLTFSEIERFMNVFFESEEKILIHSHKLIGTRGEYIKMVQDFFQNSVFLTAKSTFSHLTYWPKMEDEEERNEYIEEILLRRKLFLIEHFDGAVYDDCIEKGNPSRQLFRWYVSDNSRVANNRYFKRFYITKLGNKLKVVAVDSITRDSGWKEISEFPGILKTGELIEVKKIQSPEKEEDLAHYFSL